MSAVPQSRAISRNLPEVAVLLAARHATGTNLPSLVLQARPADSSPPATKVQLLERQVFEAAASAVELHVRLRGGGPTPLGPTGMVSLAQ